MGLALAINLQLTDMHCGSCGGWYAIDEHVRASHERMGTGWNCPYCRNGWGYNKSEADKVRADLQAERQRHAATLSRANKAETERNTVLRQLRRVKGGACPCCKRSFVKLAQHIAVKHPDFKP